LSRRATRAETEAALPNATNPGCTQHAPGAEHDEPGPDPPRARAERGEPGPARGRPGCRSYSGVV